MSMGISACELSVPGDVVCRFDRSLNEVCLGVMTRAQLVGRKPCQPAPPYFPIAIVTERVGGRVRAGRYWKNAIFIAKDIVYKNRLSFSGRARPSNIGCLVL